MSTSTIGYDNLLTDSTATVTSSTAATDYDAANAYDWNTYDSWKPTTSPAWLKLDAGAGNTFAIDYFACVHNLSTDSASIAFQYSDDDAAWVDVVSTITPTDNVPIFRQFSTSTHRYFRLYLTGAVSAIPLVYMGARLDLPVGMRPGQSLPTMSREVRLTSNVGDSGQLIGASQIATGSKGNILLTNLTPAWVRSNWNTFADHASIGRPFFFQHDNTNYEDESGLFWADKGFPTPRYTHPGFMSVDIKVRGITR